MIKLYIEALVLLSPVLSYHHAIRLQPATFEENRQNNVQNGYINFENSRGNRRFDRQSSQFNDDSNGFDWYSDNSDSNPGSSFNGGGQFNGFNWNTRNDDQQDRLVFEDDFENRNYLVRTTHRIPTTRRRPTTQRIPTSTVAIPGMGTPRTPCEDKCLSTPEYNPVCGDDNMTYFSRHRLICAQHCGKRVKLKHLGACTRIPSR